MAEGDSSLGSCMVVVGRPRRALVRTMVRLAREREIDAVPCDDVYSAVVKIAGPAGRRVLVVGPIRELAREKGVFFSIAAAHAVRCCCLLDDHGRAGRDGALAALRAGAAVLGDVQELKTILTEWLTTANPQGSSRVARDASRAARRAHDAAEETYEDLRATEAELSALLG